MKESVRKEIENIIEKKQLNCTVDNFIKVINVYELSYHKGLSEDFIREFKNELEWFRLSEHQVLSEDFIREFQFSVNWTNISQYQKLSVDFIREFKNKICWYKISEHQVLSEDFIREFKDKVSWSYISEKQKLSGCFIEEHNNYVYWNSIIKYQKLSEDFIKDGFIKKCIDYDMVYNLIKYQKLSNSFIIDNIDNENIINYKNYILHYQKLSPDIIKLFNTIQISFNNWLYKDYAFKYNKIKECGLYEIDGEYVIAYKGIRKDNYSKYNFQYQYFTGLTYECKADYNIYDENSFGLSAWTKSNALNYCDKKLIKVKIHINDIAALIHDNNKIRCSKFTVIEEVQ